MSLSWEWDNGDTKAASAAELALLGTLLVVPWWLDMEPVKSLKATDLSTPDRRAVLEAMRVEAKRHPMVWDAVTVAAELESRKVVAPKHRSEGWTSALCALLDLAAADEELLASYVRIIREAAVLRRHAMSEATV